MSGDVRLKNVIHPTSDAPVEFSIAYTEDVWSGQMDRWNVSVSGLSKEEAEALAQVFDPNADEVGSCRRAKFRIDGVDVKRSI